MRPALLWFRTDLRLHDNPALVYAAEGGRPVVAVYVLDEESSGVRPLGGASNWWLAQSLRALATTLEQHGIPLVLRRGPAADVIPALAEGLDCESVVMNSRTGNAVGRIDEAVAARLQEAGREVKRFNGHLLYKPGVPATAAGGFPKTFSAFHRAARRAPEPRRPLSLPPTLRGPQRVPDSEQLDEWGLEPSRPDWAGGLRETWHCGEDAARTRLAAFIGHGLKGYAAGRDVPAQDNVSRLSPHLAFGELSPNQVLYAIRHAAESGDVPASDADKFEAELHWREFSYHLLEAEPDIGTRNIQQPFDDFPWRDGTEDIVRWQKGLTGYPLVDAGLRQLWTTGWMHNRVRMVVASFLTKHLLIDWRQGEAWFWDTLVDADPANNAASWQWVAGTGMDAAPYFRVFNPILQGERFDPDGSYVRRFVPELARLPNSLIHKPWTADAATLAGAGIRLGATYPRPMVDHDAARERALAAFQRIKGK